MNVDRKRLSEISKLDIEINQKCTELRKRENIAIAVFAAIIAREQGAAPNDRFGHEVAFQSARIAAKFFVERQEIADREELEPLLLKVREQQG